MKNKQNSNPRLANNLLKKLLKYSDQQAILGDFEENYYKIKSEKGRFLAWLWYWGQIFYSIPAFFQNSIIWSFIMFTNNLKIAIRNFKSSKIFSFINLSGLAIGMTCTILILLWVQDEISYDRFHKNSYDLYRVINFSSSYQSRGAGTPAPLAPALLEETPEIISYTRFAPIPRLVIKHNQNVFYEDKVVLADPTIFEMFTFPFLKGDPKTALSSTENIVITEEMAHKYFGDEDPIGKLIFLEGGDEGAKITGVLKNIPHNSHIIFDFIISFELLKNERMMGTEWGDFNFNTFVQLQAGSYDTTINSKITSIALNHNCPQVKWDNSKFLLQPLTEVHLDASTLPAGVELFAELGNKRHVYIFSLIAIFILCIACINFMNLSTARSVKRVKEVGLRKVFGAGRFQLIKQFFGESVLFTILATLISILLTYIFLPTFNSLSGKTLTIQYLDMEFILGLLIIIIMTCLFAGSYPALFLSKFNPIRILKGQTIIPFLSKKDDSGNSSKGSSFRKILVVIQFSFSIGLIIGTSVVFQQLNYIKNRNLGFDKENIIYIPVRENIGAKFETVKNQLLQNPSITGVTATDWLQSRSQHNTAGYGWEGKDPEFDIKYISHVKVDYNYIPMLNIKMMEGRNFSEDFPSDATEAFIINEEAANAMELESPVGKQFRLYGKQGKIIGVMQNAHYSTLHHKINPQVYHVLTDVSRAWAYGAILIKIKNEKQNLGETLATLNTIWNEVNPNSPFEFHFYDETLESRYKSEIRTSELFNYFAILAIFISCLGLFGLASYTAEQRAKEIGIRKVLGASIVTIIKLLTKEYTKWVIIANVIAWPVSWYLMNKWLQNFSYRISIDWKTFLLSGLIAFVIAFLTVSIQSIRTATKDPVNSLRYE